MEFSEVYLISMVLLLLLGVFSYMVFKRGLFFIFLISIFANLFYILWRIKTIPTRGVAVIFGVTLFVAEVLGTIQFLNFNYFSTKKYNIKKEILKNPYDDYLKTVDVLICTYNESVDLLKKTLIAALTLDYNKSKLKVFICDYGNREEVKALCKEYDANYITRDNNEGAKAGNINNAFKNTNGEFVLILDADMIVKRNFLIKTIKYFDDEKMAFVQVHQSY